MSYFFYSIISYYSIEFIKNSKLLNSNQKHLNVIATLLIPFLWPLVVWLMLKPNKEIDLYEERKKQIGKSDWGGHYGGGDISGLDH